MRKAWWSLLLAVAMVASTTAQISIPNTFSARTAAKSDEVNQNFSTLGSQALNRTGGTLTGNLAVSAGITIDGVDVGATVCASCSPTFLALTLTDTGATALTVAGGITAGSGTVAIVGTDGRIPAISSTYFASLSAANLTAVPAGQLSGEIDDARLSANVPLLDAANAFTGANTIATLTVGTAVNLPSSVRIGTSTTAGYLLTADADGNGTWVAPGAVTSVPAGMIAIFDTSCPTSWTRVSAWDNKFLRGGATYSATAGGSDTHTHTVDPSSVTSSSNGSHAHDVTGSTDSASVAHTHSFSDTATTGTPSNTGSVNTSSPDGSVAGSNHTHSVTVSGTTGAASSTSHTHTLDVATDSNGAHTHSVDVASTSTSSGANVPAYAQVIFCKKDA